MRKVSKKQATKNREWLKIVTEMINEAPWCQECGTNFMLQGHHIVPRSKGGLYTRGNCRILCFECHEKITNKAKEKGK